MSDQNTKFQQFASAVAEYIESMKKGPPQFADQGGQEEVQRLPIEAQREELLARYTRYHTVDQGVRPGAIVVEKDGLGIIDPEQKQHTAFLFMRRLDMTDSIDLEIARYWAVRNVGGMPVIKNKVDCLLGTLSPTGAFMFYVPHDSSHLRVFDPARDDGEGVEEIGSNGNE